MTLDDFLPYVLPHAKGCSSALAKQKLRLAIIELCRKSLVWREYQNAVNTVANQTAYAYGTPTGASGQQVMTLLGLKLAGLDVEVVAADKGKRLDDAGSICVYAYGTFTGFELRPAQTAGQAIVTYAAVAPSLVATTVPDALGRYVEGIAAGALKRIHETPQLECTSPSDATAAGGRFDACVAEATEDAFRAFARTAPRVVASWM